MEKKISDMQKNYPIFFILLSSASLMMVLGFTNINQMTALFGYGLAIIFQCFALYFAIKNQRNSKK